MLKGKYIKIYKKLENWHNKNILKEITGDKCDLVLELSAGINLANFEKGIKQCLLFPSKYCSHLT